MSQDGFRAGFGPETFRTRRERVLDRLGEAVMVVAASPVHVRSGDSEYRYRPDSELLYLTGLEEPEAVAVLRGHSDDHRFALFVRARDSKAEQWSGGRLGPDAARDLIGADVAYPMSELEERLPAMLHEGDAVYFRLGTDARSEALVLQALEWARRRGARTGQGPRSVVDPGQILSELRLRKDSAELETLRRAADITVAAFERLAAAIAPGVGEWELEALLDGQFRSGGGEGPGFATIVGSGVNACVLHYVSNQARLQRGDLVLVDAGAEVDYYTADITRTFPVSGTYSAEQRAVYDIVLEAQRSAIDEAWPGHAADALHNAAVRVIADGLRHLGVLDGSIDEIIESGSYRGYYPHQTSHWLGLDVHDPGDYVVGGVARSLEPGMVVTVEPGLYFPRDDEPAGRFRGIGIRTEDDVLVTDTGPERLTGGLVSQADEVAALVGRSDAGL